MEDGLRAQVMTLKSHALFNSLEQRIHVFIDFQHLGQMLAIARLHTLLQRLHERINRRDVRKMQHRLFLPWRMANQRR